MSHIVLLGLMGAGKTELGRLLAERFDRPLLDGDGLQDRFDQRYGDGVVLVRGFLRPVAA